MNGCSVDLHLSPMTSCRRDSTVSDQASARRCKDISEFNSGRLGEYDVVEIQIRAIIEMASKQCDVTALELAPVRLGSPLGFSVKRSVKRFLEKRKKKRSKFVTLHSYTCTSSSSSSSHNF